MRAREFLSENSDVNPPESLKTKIVYKGWNFDVAIDGADVSIIVLDDPDNIDSQIAYAVLARDGKNLYPDDLAILEKHNKRRGIASSMYDYLKELGFRIHRIPKNQTTAGKRFWQKHRSDEKVWETINYDNLDNPGHTESHKHDDIVYKLTVVGDGKTPEYNLIEITARYYDKLVGEATFGVTEDGKNLYSLDTHVDKLYRRRGIATHMYQMALQYGDIVPSHALSTAGIKLHRGLRKKNILEEIDEAFTKSPDHYSAMAYKLGSEQKLSLLGKGYSGIVYTHATKDNTVVKIFANDRGYAEWLKWIIKHPTNKYVPRVIPHEDGSIIKLYKYFERRTTTTSQRIGIVYLEKLEEINNDELFKFSKHIISYLDEPAREKIEKLFLKRSVSSYFDLLNSGDWHVISLNAENAGDNDLYQLADFFSRHSFSYNTNLDLHLKNIMRRANGQFVFVDPLVGS